MEAKELGNYITVGMIGIGVAVLIGYYLKNRLALSARAAWAGAPTLAGFMTFCIWFVILAGLGGMWVGGRMVVCGAPVAMAQSKK